MGGPYPPAALWYHAGSPILQMITKYKKVTNVHVPITYIYLTNI